MQIELLSHPGCPNAAAARETLAECLGSLGIDVPITEHVGDFPSPSVVINDADVMRAGAVPIGRSCRLDLPTREAIMAALHQATEAEHRRRLRERA